MSTPTQDRQEEPGFFDKFASATDTWTSKSWFFLASVLMVIVWLPTYLAVPDVDTWQLLINTPTTVITFLLVALQANTNARANAALQTKLNSLSAGVADLLDNCGESGQEADELRKAVGLEDKEST